MVKPSKEVKRDYRIRKGDELREKEKKRSRDRRSEAKKDPAKIEKQRKQALARMQAMRQRRRELVEQQQQEAESLESTTYSSSKTLNRAVNRAWKGLPRSLDHQRVVVRQLAKNLGVQLVDPPKISRERIPFETIDAVAAFFDREDVSRWTPGRKEYVKVNGQQIQKRYLVAGMKELHHLFIHEHVEHKLSLSKFCELRPRHILTFSKTPLEACCCKLHENFKSALAGATGMPSYSSRWVGEFILCNPATLDCNNGQCQRCASGDNHRLVSPTDEEKEHVVRFHQWDFGADGRVQQQPVQLTVADTFKMLVEQLPAFVLHHQTKQVQASFFRNQKDALADGELLLHFDFSENYTCSQQDMAQSAYWNQAQVTLFTVAAYWPGGSKMMAIVSDHLHHSKEAISTFLRHLMQKFCESRQPKVVHFWSDGPASQFKNRFMMKLQHDEARFSLARL
uniref:CxC1 domain-containing protein n=3 Tax=Macrostomum lignano TaxID=282301 RepID=A0A1I8I8W6_9PLAT